MKTRNEHQISYRKRNPWASRLFAARQRCNNKNTFRYDRYGGRGIKCFLVIKEIKDLWFRDKAYLMDRPSIDRIDNDGDYVYENCRFIEYRENAARCYRLRMRSIIKKSLDGRILKIYKSVGDAVREFGNSNFYSGTIVNCLKGRRKTAHGYKWAYTPPNHNSSLLEEE